METIKSLNNQRINLKGLHKIKRQKAIIKNNKIDKRIANIRIHKAEAHISIIEMHEARKALGTTSNKKVMDALHKLAKNN